MKKSGFTLVELLAVIVILCVIGMITVPVVNVIIKDTKQKSYNAQISLIVEAGKKWGLKNVEKLPVDDDVLYVTVGELISNGYIAKVENGKLINPIDDTEMTGCVLVKYISEYNQYSYEYKEKCE